MSRRFGPVRSYVNGREGATLIKNELAKEIDYDLLDNPAQIELDKFKEIISGIVDRKKMLDQYVHIVEFHQSKFLEKQKIEFDIQKIRFFVVNGDFENAVQLIDKHKDTYRQYSTETQYFWFKHLGNYYYSQGKYPDALDCYLEADKNYAYSLPPLEEGDICYVISMAANHCWEPDLSLKYAYRALEIYQREFIPRRIAECHVNLGITQLKLRNFKTAIDHNLTAQKTGAETNSPHLKFATEYNCGYIYFQFQNYEKSIEHIMNSLKATPDEYAISKLKSIITLIKAYLELNDMQSVFKWMYNANNLISDVEIDKNTHRDTYEAYIELKILENYSKKDFEAYENLFFSDLMPIMIEGNHLYELGYYYNHIGQFYVSQERFEEASKMLLESSKYIKQLLTL
ncbi:tetratricopeptide repeat protein [Paenisporosarcina cavernae]|uniref:Tetratricopeptide repeat protein n=1 Tax=Paenisporosarcina cavernae TaxID=2320858 RepID=A0A385YQT8_9BACL|nr:tetratricopeptide repeat protein [Paenisporosarcina cavernae]AYC28864.1 tetratricopeptide repeat protein [Paenisporosarcina cavernae]